MFFLLQIPHVFLIRFVGTIYPSYLYLIGVVLLSFVLITTECKTSWFSREKKLQPVMIRSMTCPQFPSQFNRLRHSRDVYKAPFSVAHVYSYSLTNSRYTNSKNVKTTTFVYLLIAEFAKPHPLLNTAHIPQLYNLNGSFASTDGHSPTDINAYTYSGVGSF